MGVTSGLSLATRMSNLMSVALTVLELLPFNAQIFRGSRDRGQAPFVKIFGGHVRTVPGKTCVKFEVRIALTVLELLAFNSHDRPLRTHKHTNKHTSNERIISAIHFVHLAEIMMMMVMTMNPWEKDARRKGKQMEREGERQRGKE